MFYILSGFSDHAWLLCPLYWTNLKELVSLPGNLSSIDGTYVCVRGWMKDRTRERLQAFGNYVAKGNRITTSSKTKLLSSQMIIFSCYM